MENNKELFIQSNIGICIKNPMRQARIIGCASITSTIEWSKSKRNWFSWLGESSGSSFDVSSFATGLACGSCL